MCLDLEWSVRYTGLTYELDSVHVKDCTWTCVTGIEHPRDDLPIMLCGGKLDLLYRSYEKKPVRWAFENLNSLSCLVLTRDTKDLGDTASTFERCQKGDCTPRNAIMIARYPNDAHAGRRREIFHLN
jgi:hypothetical protein